MHTTPGSVNADDGHRIAYEVTDGTGSTGSTGGGPKATIVFLPAMGVPLRYYAPLAQAWAAAGNKVVGVEHRGQPLSPVSGRPAFGYSDLVRRDLPAVFGVAPVREARRVILVGHSMGGALALLSTAAGLVAPAAVVTVATGTSWCAAEFGPYRKAKRHLGTSLVRATSAALGYWPGHRMGFGGRQPRTLMRDWAYEAQHGRFRLHDDSFDYEEALSAMTTPRLLLGIEGDPLINGRAVALLARRAHHAERRHLTLSRPGSNHFTWARRSPSEVTAAIAAWDGSRG